MGDSKATPHRQSTASGSKNSAAEEPMSARRKTSARDAASATSRNKAAKKTAYRSLFANIIKFMCMNGVPLDDIAAAFKVDKITIDRWKRAYKDFDDAFQLGVGLADARVPRSLHQLACGYDYVDVKIFRHKRRILYAPFTVHVPADVQAAIFWLTNRLSNEWSSKPNARKTQRRILTRIANMRVP